MEKKVWLYIGGALLLAAVVQLVIAGPSAGSTYESPEDHAVWRGFEADNELFTLSENESYKIWIQQNGTIEVFTIKNSRDISVFDIYPDYETGESHWVLYGAYYPDECPCTINLNSTDDIIFTNYENNAGTTNDADGYFTQMMFASMTCCLGIIILVSASSLKILQNKEEVELQQ